MRNLIFIPHSAFRIPHSPPLSVRLRTDHPSGGNYIVLSMSPLLNIPAIHLVTLWPLAVYFAVVILLVAGMLALSYLLGLYDSDDLTNAGAPLP